MTKPGIANGLPLQGTLTATGPDGQTRLLNVVGIATGQTGLGTPFLVAMPALVTSTGDPARVSLAFLVTRPYPVTWADVRRMNDYGLLAQNHQMFLNPPADSELNLQMAQMLGPGQQANNLLLLLAVVGIFIETTLLTTPAVAVSAARQRRSLSLAASNGAETHQLWRYVLGQAVVLGVVSAAVAAVTANT